MRNSPLSNASQGIQFRVGSAIEVYQKGGRVKAEIDGILAAEFCQDLLAPVNAAYADEKAGIMGEV